MVNVGHVGHWPTSLAHVMPRCKLVQLGQLMWAHVPLVTLRLILKPKVMLMGPKLICTRMSNLFTKNLLASGFVHFITSMQMP
jgi:hypothetical protein